MHLLWCVQAVYSWVVAISMLIFGACVITGFVFVLPALKEGEMTFSLDGDLPLKVKIGIRMTFVGVLLSHILFLIDMLYLIWLQKNNRWRRLGLNALFRIVTIASFVTIKFARNYDQYSSVRSPIPDEQETS